MGSSAALLVVIAAVLIGLLLFAGPLMALVGNLPLMIQDWIAQIRGSLPGAGGNVTGSVGIGFLLTFTDGTTQEINQNLTYSILPLSISFDSKDLANIRISVNAKLKSTVTDWHSTTSMRIELYKKPDATPVTSSTGSYPQSGSAWTANAIKTLAQVSFQASVLDQVVAQSGGNGNYLLQVTANVDLTVTASDGAQVTVHATSFAAGIDFTYSDGTPVSISIFAPPKTLTP